MNLAFWSDVVFYCVKLCVGFGEKVCTSVVGNDGFFFFFFLLLLLQRISLSEEMT